MACHCGTMHPMLCHVTCRVVPVAVRQHDACLAPHIGITTAGVHGWHTAEVRGTESSWAQQQGSP